MSRYHLSFIFAALMGLAAFRFEDDFLQKLVTQLDTYQRQNPQEKVYLHLDRPYYTAGETLWLKAYVTFASDLQADTLSRVLYVDLIDKQRAKAIVSKKIKLQNGLGQGDIALSDSLRAGDYQLRAYTHYMRNFPDDFFFRRDVRILRADASVQGILPPNADDVDFQLFPEGGQLVQNIESRIAFKATNVLGQGVKIEGFVLNQANDTIVGFADEHLGMGSFNFKPEPNQQYRIQIKKTNGQFTTVTFPKIEESGYVMTVDNLSNKENVRVFIRHNLPPTTEEIALLAHHQGIVTYAAKAPLTKKSILFSIPRAKMGHGISHLTVFDAQSRPRCERLVFIDTPKSLDIQITSNKNTYSPREKVTIDINVKNSEGKPVAGSFSLAATDAAQVLESPQAQSITSYLHLEGDLRGYIEQPMLYFDPQNTNASRQMDVLLMTQGWRRFGWADVLRDKPTEVKYLIEQGISITGKVLRPNGKAGGKVNLTFMLRQRDSTQLFLMGESIETGEFAAYNIDVKDSVKVLIQASNAKGNRNFVVNLDPYIAVPVTLSKIPYNPIQFDPKLLMAYLQRANEYLEIERRIRQNREKLLQEVVVKGKRTVEVDTRRALYTTPSNTLKFDNTNTAGAMTIFDVIQARIPGVQVSGSGMDRTVQIRGAANFSGVVEPTFVLDGVVVSKDAILTIPPNDVEAVDVLKGAEASIYGSQGAGGVIAVLTKRGNVNYDFSQEKAEGTLVFQIMGYHPVREFYAPKYDTPIPDHIRPDFRATLHWAPMVQTDSTGRAQLSFFATDAKTDLQLSVEGITPEGITGTGQKRIKVQ